MFSTIKVYVIVFLVCFLPHIGLACTSAIITGKATPDGRPLLWKHRDTSVENNRMVYVQGEKHTYIGLTNSNDKNNNEIWCGSNDSGFCIMNTASYNLKPSNDSTTFADREGILMRMALEVCSTIADFERLLDTLQKPMGIEANFGVIDAQGGAAFYETTNFEYTKYDANDSALAPHGYLIRTNFSESGDRTKDRGYVRCLNANYLFSHKSEPTFTPEWILKEVARSYYNDEFKHDLKELKPQTAIDQDYIPRFTSTASVIFQGVTQQQPVEQTTIWTVLGFPSTSVVFPLWIAGGKNLPSMLTRSEKSDHAEFCDKVLTLKYQVFDISERNKQKRTMHFDALYNDKGTGIIQKNAHLEAEIFSDTYTAMELWNKIGWREQNIQIFYKHLSQKIEKAYLTNFGL